MEFGRKQRLTRADKESKVEMETEREIETEREWNRVRVVSTLDIYIFSSAGVCSWLFIWSEQQSFQLAGDMPLLLLIKDCISTLFPFLPIYWNNQYLHAPLGWTSQNHMLSHWPASIQPSLSTLWEDGERRESLGPYNNGCRNAKFLAIISVYWPGLHELFPTCWDSEIVCVSLCVCVW